MQGNGGIFSTLRRKFSGLSRPKTGAQTAQAAHRLAEASRQHLLNSNSSFAVTEAYKSARTNLLFTRSEEGCRRLVITSAMESEGKTLNCLNIGITLAQSDLKVLVIDADMRRPMVQRDLEVASACGLSELLAGMASAELQHDPVRALATTRYPNLSVLTSGPVPPNPAELLASSRMKELLDKLSETFDFILIDTPPVSLVTDAAVLSKIVGGYLFVVRAGHTPLDLLKDCVQRLDQVGGSIVGFLLNGVEMHTGYYRYSRYGKYGHYGRYGRYSYAYGTNAQSSDKTDNSTQDGAVPRAGRG